MIIRRQEDVTPAVLDAYSRIADPRMREVVQSLVKHLHAFAQEVRLTDAEFRTGIAKVVAMGQQSNDHHNEVMLMSEELDKLVVNRASSEDVRRCAAEQGMMDLRSDGLAKVALGLTTLSEVSRVVA